MHHGTYGAHLDAPGPVRIGELRAGVPSYPCDLHASLDPLVRDLAAFKRFVV